MSEPREVVNLAISLHIETRSACMVASGRVILIDMLPCRVLSCFSYSVSAIHTLTLRS